VARCVTDTGPGIAEQHVPNLFERFYRVDSSRTRATGGAGIGLAVVKQLVEAHGGRVGVRSVVGNGSSFSFSLPLARVDSTIAELPVQVVSRSPASVWLDPSRP
jgi:signal transduction histidine kinase